MEAVMTDTTTSEFDAAKSKLLVLGATGGTGRLIVQQALARGYDVTALVRSPDKAHDLKGAKILVGDARDGGALRNALNGQFAVVSALGTGVSPFKEVTFLSTATRALVDAMTAEQVSRLVAITGMGAGDSRGHGGFVFDNLVFPFLLRNVYADKDRQEAIVRQSGLDWVLVRPAILTNKPAGARVQAMTDLSAFHGGSIARSDVASFVLDQMQGDRWLRQSPLIVGE
jgi:uncharacterized protein YbjT (DUF2867 family)